ncbi:tetratricopeptide repeat protein [Prosthecobacter sp.]|uniref:tetratricopeptide repeat protein n=1 Tax=Prosthecobacter sp. TaxID=1965333 RepID=UPI003782F2A5
MPSSDDPLVIRSQHLDGQSHFLWLPGRRQRLAAESYDVGYACRSSGNVPLAETNFRRVQTLLQGVRPSRFKRSMATCSLLAASHNHLGMLCLDTGRPADARPSFDRAIEIRKELLRLFPKERENEIYLGGALCNRAHSVADSDAAEARDFYQQSLAMLRQPDKPCECAYWDEERQSWWCTQMEALGNALGMPWVFLAPQFIDNAMRGLDSLKAPDSEKSAS